MHWSLSEVQARELAKWDVVVLDMEVQERSATLLRRMREWNPNITLLAYITPQEIVQNPGSSDSALRRKLGAKIFPEWYVYDTTGNKTTFWPGTYILNVSIDSPRVNNKQFSDVMAEFVAQDILGTGLWDGVFYDNAWDDVRYFAGENADLNRDGVKEKNLQASWQAGTEALYSKTRQLTRNRFIIVANGDSRAYRDQVNGKMLENFSEENWQRFMDTYAYNQNTPHQPQIQIVNSNTDNGAHAQSNYQRMRFALGSTLLEDGYFSYDFGDTNHGQLWWYDEYNAHLGDPITSAVSLQGNTTYKPDVWQRQFENGIAVVNSSDKSTLVSLGGDYESLRGTQDTSVNNGSIVSEVSLAPKDGRILLKTFSTLQNTMFTNGAFARFFRPNGDRVRNGFFVFEDAYKGKDTIIHTDLNFDKKDDLLVVSGGKIQAWRDDTQPFFRVYPYTANYRGELNITIADLDNDTWKEVIVAPGSGSNLPIKIYQLNGDVIKTDWKPLGPLHAHGYHVAVGRFGQGDIPRLIVSSDTGGSSLVRIFDLSLKQLTEWYAFDTSFRGGVSIAAGDVDGNGEDEIVVSPASGAKPWIKTMTLMGQEVFPQFLAYSALGTPGIHVEVTDVDFDGKDDIVGLSEGI
ncbi:MAG: hypothetical protein KBD15_00610 [Candidatus Magasanikbacteria bacterium]|nr:hypothetical protein [Candidatus Magasanikbacteria bacterium]